MPVLILNEHPDLTAELESSSQQCGEYLLTATGNSEQQYTIVVTTDGTVRELNRTYRQIDKPTNVLSFPFEISEESFQALIPCNELGDIVISLDRAREESRSYRCTLEHRLNWLIVHGFLHLIGYDHETSPDDAEIMYRKEQALMSDLPLQA